jgi:(E)-4-hydroxy-3-methylbut-2-enyl-diphosphate synthase
MTSIQQGRFGSFRRETIEVKVGSTAIGGTNPILVQSMTTTLTKDIDATVAQTVALANAGCELVRITTPTQADAACLEEIMRKVRAQGVTVPVCADIHFQPNAAFEAVKWVEKIRVNPGNFVDAKTAYGFQKDFSDDTYERGLQKINDKFRPLVKLARERGAAIRIGTNHGSLSDRILSRWGDSPEGMVESAREYLKVCEDEGFDQVVFSMKSSNPKVVIQCYRMLVERLAMGGHKAYPIHLGVTEAGEGRDGRMKSAVGIGALLLDGIGDTIRVSLTEDPLEEIPVARELLRATARPFAGDLTDFGGDTLRRPFEAHEKLDPFTFRRRETLPVLLGETTVGGGNPVRVGSFFGAEEPNKDRVVEWFDGSADLVLLDAGTDMDEVKTAVSEGRVMELVVPDPAGIEEVVKTLPPSNLYMFSTDLSKAGPWGARRMVAAFEAAGLRAPLVLRWFLDGSEINELRMAATLGSLLCDGYGDTICLMGESRGNIVDLSYDLLQCAGARRSKTEFISCPSCGRTLFDLVSTSAAIRAKTGHLKDVSIAIMGCIVNGPGEMADADFGYVGGTPGSVNLYVRRDCVKRGIPELEAPDALVALIKEHGRWINP